jgi:hypothetical protein
MALLIWDLAVFFVKKRSLECLPVLNNTLQLTSQYRAAQYQRKARSSEHIFEFCLNFACELELAVPESSQYRNFL